MAKPLKNKIAVHIYKDLLVSNPLFKSAGDRVLGHICELLQRKIFLPNEFVFCKGDIGNELFIISKGIIFVLADEDHIGQEASVPKKPVVLSEGDFFGEIGLIMDVRL